MEPASTTTMGSICGATSLRTARGRFGFPGEPLNAQDSLFNEALVLTVEKAPDGSLRALFDFVLAPY